MNKSNSPIQRIDKDFEQEMKKIAKIRLDNGLARFNPQSLSIREMTRLLRRTNGYQQSLEELKIKPKKEDKQW